MATANPYWGAPRIHGELLKLGMEISARTVSRLMSKYRKPPSQTWKAFLNNHVQGLVSVDFFTVPTVSFRALFVFIVPAHRAFQRDGASDGGLDRSAIPGSVSRRHGATIFDPRLGPDLRGMFPQSPQRHRHHRSSDCSAKLTPKFLKPRANNFDEAQPTLCSPNVRDTA